MQIFFNPIAIIFFSTCSFKENVHSSIQKECACIINKRCLLKDRNLIQVFNVFFVLILRLCKETLDKWRLYSKFQFELLNPEFWAYSPRYSAELIQISAQVEPHHWSAYSGALHSTAIFTYEKKKYLNAFSNSIHHFCKDFLINQLVFAQNFSQYPNIH